jgi:DNA-binding IclR family transcriptional regulator
MEAVPLSRASAPTGAFPPADAPSASSWEGLLDPPHHPRHRILEEVGARPGLSITDIATATGLGHTTVCHHLAVLQRRRFVVRERWGGAVRIFPANLAPVQRALVALSHQGKTGAVLRALAAEPRATPASLARVLGLHRQAVQWHLARLEKAGVVQVDREHRPYRLNLTIRPETVVRLLPPPAGEAAAPLEEEAEAAPEPRAIAAAAP